MSKRRIIISCLIVILLDLLALLYLNQSRRIVAAIIPHHSLANELVVDLANRLSKKPPAKILIIGPNHDETGLGNLTSDPKILATDHACYSPKNTLQSILPQTKIDCLLVSTKTTSSEIEKLINQLDPSTLLIASIDFSHYLTFWQASAKDQKTKEIILNYQTNRLRGLTNDYLDSPLTLVILFEYLKKHRLPPAEIIANHNSYTLAPHTNPDSTTSYFEVIYYR